MTEKQSPFFGFDTHALFKRATPISSSEVRYFSKQF